MAGFFETENEHRAKTHQSKAMGCYSCGLYRKCKNPKFDYYGKGEKGILIVDSRPSKREDDIGKQGIGPTNNFLKEVLESFDIDMEQDCWKVNAVRCYNGHTLITNTHLNSCRTKLLRTVEELRPKKIIALGYDAMYGLVGHRMSSRISLTPKSFEPWTGWAIPDQELETMIYPVYNLYEVYKSDDQGLTDKLFYKQIKNALDGEEYKRYNYTNEIETTTDVKQAIKYLKELSTKSYTAFDYETNSLKPHEKGRKIICIGISDGIKGYGFPIFNDRKFLTALRRYLQSNSKKLGHNIQFEELWTQTILGYSVKNWDYDSMLGMHALDNRPRITGLKFQSYVSFGIVGYDDSIDSYLRPAEGEESKSANALNKLEEAPIEEVIQYCATDAHLTFHLGMKQKKKLFADNHLTKGYNLLHEGALTMVDISQNGIKVNEEALLRNELDLEKRLLKLTKEITRSREAKEFEERYKTKFNFNSPDHLGKVFYEILEFPVVKWTSNDPLTRKASTDKEALENIDSDLAKLILEYKRMYKIKNTYLAGIRRESVNGYIHPNFALHLVVSYRSSSQNPNAQNFPKHDDYAMNMIRSCLGPHPGQFLVEADYSGAETRVSVDYNQDKMLLKYLMDESTDMHRDIASDLFMKPAEEITKEERFAAKNGITFAFFYGSSGFNAAIRLWNILLTDEQKKDLAKKGIKTFEKFAEHLENLHRIFWKERFTEYGKWKDEMWDFYKKNGFIRYKTGFRAVGKMSYNDSSNYQIQGSAFHCLLWAVIQVNKFLKENNYKSKVVFQIHDSIGLSIEPSEWLEIKDRVSEIMTTELHKHWPWLKVPMRADFDFYNTSWQDVCTEEELLETA